MSLCFSCIASSKAVLDRTLTRSGSAPRSTSCWATATLKTHNVSNLYSISETMLKPNVPSDLFFLCLWPNCHPWIYLPAESRCHQWSPASGFLGKIDIGTPLQQQTHRGLVTMLGRDRQSCDVHKLPDAAHFRTTFRASETCCAVGWDGVGGKGGGNNQNLLLLRKQSLNYTLERTKTCSCCCYCHWRRLLRWRPGDRSRQRTLRSPRATSRRECVRHGPP